MGGETDQFHTTRWTLVMASAHDQIQAGRAALAALVRLIGTHFMLLLADADIHRLMLRI